MEQNRWRTFVFALEKHLVKRVQALRIMIMIIIHNQNPKTLRKTMRLH